jgi:CRISPR-associated protein Cas1
MGAQPLPDSPHFPIRLVPAKAGYRGRAELPELLPARMLNEFVYCPRLFFYEWVEGVFARSVDTIEGAQRHEKLGEKPEALPDAAGSPEGPIHSRSVMLSSDAHKLIAEIDLVEGSGTTVTPVDYKKGSPMESDDGPLAWPADRVQVCAQALILRDNGYACREAIVYYSATKQRVRITIDDDLERQTLDAAAAARALAAGGRIAEPLLDSPKCPRCSLVGICLPDETAAAMALPPDPGGDVQLPLFCDLDPAQPRPLDRPPLGDVRRLVPARDDLRPLYVTGHGLFVGKSGEVLQIRDKKKLVQEARLHELSQINLLGSVSMSSAAVQGACWAEKPVAHFSSGGWFYGLTTGLGLKNVFLRREQFRRADDAVFCLLVARDIVTTKIRNQRTLLQRNHLDPPAVALNQLKRLALHAANSNNLESLLGTEGSSARVYFEHFAGMLKVGDETPSPSPVRFDFNGRNRRPPRDPINALLSFAYSLLARDLTIVCHAVGFDPFVGYYHQPRFGRPALALDLMEGFRPLIADSAVLTAVNTGMVGPDDFIQAGQSVALTAAGRKGFIRAYEQRMDALVTHPLFGYRVNYRRILEIQARLLARFITGELSRYPGFETR